MAITATTMLEMMLLTLRHLRMTVLKTICKLLWRRPAEDGGIGNTGNDGKTITIQNDRWLNSLTSQEVIDCLYCS